jgi:hypothetical protein
MIPSLTGAGTIFVGGRGVGNYLDQTLIAAQLESALLTHEGSYLQ